MVKTFAKHVLNIKNKMMFLGKNIRFLQNVTIDSNCKLEGFNSIGEKNSFYNVQIGKGTYTGKNVQLSCVSIGRFCSIGSFIRNTTGNHPTRNYVSTHPAFFSETKASGFTFSNHQKFKELKFVKDRFLVLIGNDVWIGDNVIILDGISIGDGAIVGAGSVITKNIDPYTIVAGNPAKVIRQRFEPEIISFLQRFKWWDREIVWLKENFNDFDNAIKFKVKYEED